MYNFLILFVNYLLIKYLHCMNYIFSMVRTKLSACVGVDVGGGKIVPTSIGVSLAESPSSGSELEMQSNDSVRVESESSPAPASGGSGDDDEDMSESKPAPASGGSGDDDDDSIPSVELLEEISAFKKLRNVKLLRIVEGFKRYLVDVNERGNEFVETVEDCLPHIPLEKKTELENRMDTITNKLGEVYFEFDYVKDLINKIPGGQINGEDTYGDV